MMFVGSGSDFFYPMPQERPQLCRAQEASRTGRRLWQIYRTSYGGVYQPTNIQLGGTTELYGWLVSMYGWFLDDEEFRHHRVSAFKWATFATFSSCFITSPPSYDVKQVVSRHKPVPAETG